MQQKKFYAPKALEHKPELKVLELVARVVAAIQEFGAVLAIAWQQAGSGLICRYVCALSPSLLIDILHTKDDRLIISLSNGDQWHADHDQLLPTYAHDLAKAIAHATQYSARVTFKQDSLKKIMGGNHAR
jgi:hypothetical protein